MEDLARNVLASALGPRQAGKKAAERPRLVGRLDYLPFLGSLGSKVFVQNHFTAIETFDILKNLVKVLGKKHDMKRTTFFSISRSFSYLPLKLHNMLIL